MDPDYSLALERNSAVLTLVTIEQLAGRFEAFLDYLLHWRPGLCIHVEPIAELYAPGTTCSTPGHGASTGRDATRRDFCRRCRTWRSAASLSWYM
jgi:hypothetical protein